MECDREKAVVEREEPRHGTDREREGGGAQVRSECE